MEPCCIDAYYEDHLCLSLDALTSNPGCDSIPCVSQKVKAPRAPDMAASSTHRRNLPESGHYQTMLFPRNRQQKTCEGIERSCSRSMAQARSVLANELWLAAPATCAARNLDHGVRLLASDNS